MKLLYLSVLMVSLCVMSRARHIHPHGVNSAHNVDEDIAMPNEDDYTIQDYKDIASIHHVKPTRFVPINDALFFKNYEPCEDGYVRDLLGVCREIWD